MVLILFQCKVFASLSFVGVQRAGSKQGPAVGIAPSGLSGQGFWLLWGWERSLERLLTWVCQCFIIGNINGNANTIMSYFS